MMILVTGHPQCSVKYTGVG
ncbi:hypothetical protein GMOD_00002489 [Pyrenophora seminiperda CCB06]|uniref:Uncharacterized protein n=1 Tax=Pyrenophora seminiperda CCB06 TaxID=1302712 RepID=A0A3M7M2J0_9PLEO|nr:hypothetical protein GMOD_00002489 [Pyrenophora seminiperda CCB06]